MSRRLEWSVAIAALAAAVLFRAWPFVWWPGAHFDSDQAIVGLMAKHVSEGRAFPLYYYGQSYMLGVEAWLAAPVMLAAGATVAALKSPLVLINGAAVALLARVIVTEAGTGPLLAAVAALPLALPAAGVAARVVEANGGNVEPWVYVIVLWMLRGRPWPFGIVLGLATAHREFVFYGAAALAGLDLIERIATPAGRAPAMAVMATDRGARGWLTHWCVIVVAALAARAVLGSLEPFASALGPGTRGNDPVLAGMNVDTLGSRLCLDPGSWGTRARLLLTDHLPRLAGGFPAPLAEYGVLTRVPAGFSGVAVLAGALTLGGLIAGWSRGLTRATAFGWYLLAVAAISTLVYGFGTCSAIRVETLRYNLLGLLAPAGALVLLLTWPGRGSAPSPGGNWLPQAVRAGTIAATVVWCALNASDVWALGREYLDDPPADQRQALATALERRGIAIAWSDFRTAYHVTFLAQERVRVSAHDYARILSYFNEAVAAKAPTIGPRTCDGGELILPRVYLCR